MEYDLGIAYSLARYSWNGVLAPSSNLRFEKKVCVVASATVRLTAHPISAIIKGAGDNLSVFRNDDTAGASVESGRLCKL